jgi:choice-of-anchor B domain-containing protein
MNRAATYTISFALAMLLAVPLTAQQFGGSVAVSGDLVFVGEAGNQTLSGIVYVFGETNGAWSEIDQIRVTDVTRAPDGFGRAIAADAATLLAGAPIEGTAYVFERTGEDAWSESARLAGPPDSDFGAAVALTDRFVIVAAPSEGRGVVYVYDRSSLNAPSRLAAPADVGETFGATLATDGVHLLVGAATSGRTTGSVHAYRMDGLEPLGELSAEGLPERSGYGSALAVHDGLAYVGVPGFDNGVGAVFVFELGDDGWTAGAPLRPTLAARNTQFGASIAASAGGLLVGAPGADGGAGALYQLDATDGVTQVTITGSETAGEGAGFGGSVAAVEGVLAVGALSVDEGAGATVIFDEWTEQTTVVNEARGFPAITGGEIECAEGQADIFECEGVNIISFVPINEIGGVRGTRVNDIWGWTDPETGTEYAIVGRTNGTSFIDLSDPSRPVYVGDLPKTPGSRSAIWRDMKVYRDHVYVVADGAGAHGVQVLDLRELRRFQGEPITFEETFHYDGIYSAHNIVINEETGFAYTVGNSAGGETCGGGLHMLNLEDPARPTFDGCYADTATGRSLTGYAHDAQCVIYRGPDAEHVGREICLGSNETALSIADVTDKSAPVTLASASYPNVAYAHQGWLTEDHRYFYMNDEGDEPSGLVEGTRTLVWDVQDLDDPILVHEYIAETSATDHNLYIVGDVMYQSNYDAGFRVIDISEPERPVEIGYFDTSPYRGGASWSNYPFFESGIIAVTGTGDGLFILRDVSRRLIS